MRVGWKDHSSGLETTFVRRGDLETLTARVGGGQVKIDGLVFSRAAFFSKFFKFQNKRDLACFFLFGHEERAGGPFSRC